MRRFLAVIAGAGLASLAGCGGGGSEGGGGSGGPASTTPVVYVGNSGAAVITATNAGVITANLTGNGSNVPSNLSLARNAQFPDAGLIEVGRRLSAGVRRSIDASLHDGRGGLRLAIPVDETEPCDTGSVRTVGTLSDDATGTLSVTYNNCLLGDDTVNGAATLRVDAYDLAFDTATDFTLGFARLVIRGPGLSVDVGGSLRTQVDIFADTETTTQNLVVLDNATGRISKSENLVLVDVHFPIGYVETVTGRIYEGVHGFVDVATLVNLGFATATQEFPDRGLLELTGAAGARIRATAVSSSVVVLALDLDGNGTLEIAATLNWVDLAGPIGADLRDTDGDGMHDSWETAKGLNPSDPADALLDPDGDGAHSLSEYLAGTNPASAGSAPPMVGLSLSAFGTPNPVTVGNGFGYHITVANAAGSSAANVVVTSVLPSSVSLFSATSTRGSCSGAASIVCQLGTMDAATSANVTISMIAGTAGVVSGSITVGTDSFEPDASDNSATIVTTVGNPVGGIQAQIDAAATGATVNVAPGIYVGLVDFGGKDIVLQSSAGPITTILHGSSSLAVRMGPGGTIRGFTITGSGSGIQTSGTGSVITGNVFDGNIQTPGGFGAAVGGNAASPTIERNVFRNNSCDNQNLAGVVSFLNASSPQVYNNVFENNACRAINLSVVDSTSTPLVINNTFVSNRTAITGLRTGLPVSHAYRNNILVQNSIALDLQEGLPVAPPVWENNLLFANTTDYVGTSSQNGINGNISGASPLFVNQAGGDYHLQAGSPAIDAGSATGAPATDFDGGPRGTPDIGAFEAIP